MSEHQGDINTGASRRAFELHRRGELAEAEQHYREALRNKPDDPDLLHRLGLLLYQAGRPGEAATQLQRALNLDSSAAQTWLLLAMVQSACGEQQDALESARRSLELQPGNPRALNLAGHLLQQLGNPAEARELLQRALSIRPDLADAWHNLAIALAALGELPGALDAYQRALQLQPGNAQLHCNYGLALLHNGRIAEADRAFKAALERQPGHLPARLERLYTSLLLCDWDELETDQQKLQVGLKKMLQQPSPTAISPYILNLVPLPAELTSAVTRRYASALQDSAARLIGAPVVSQSSDGPLRIAYLSPDFGAHAVGGLVHGLFRHHDRRRFHVSALSLRRFDDYFADQIRAGCDEFIDLHGLSLQDAAKCISENRPQILIDLGGYTAGTRPELVAARLAPLQLSWLGYLNSSGGSFVDYLLADEVALPAANASAYSEQIARLPVPFLPASPMPVAASRPRRSELGLPEDQLVFCSFNNTYKIQPDSFAAWMQILKRVPGSVLWLYAGNTREARTNLARQAERRKVAPERIVFADALPMDQHMARLPCADLFLDTFHYNAGATAVGALAAGVPLLTLAGTRMLGRMGASLNAAMGLSRLTCESATDYVERAVWLAENPGELHELRKSLLAKQRDREDDRIKRFTADLENLLEKLWARHAAGEPPATMGI